MFGHATKLVLALGLVGCGAATSPPGGSAKPVVENTRRAARPLALADQLSRERPASFAKSAPDGFRELGRRDPQQPTREALDGCAKAVDRLSALPIDAATADIENAAFDATRALLVANDLARQNEPVAVSASALLARGLGIFKRWTHDVLTRYRFEAISDPNKLEAVARIAGYAKTATAFSEHAAGHAARVLREGSDDQIGVVLRTLAEERRDELGAQAFEAYRARLSEPLDAEDSVLYAHATAWSLRTSDSRFETIAAEAERLVRDSGSDRRQLARLERSRTVRVQMKRLAALGNASVEQRIERYDLLRSLNRLVEADNVLEALGQGADKGHGLVRARRALRELTRAAADGTTDSRKTVKQVRAALEAPPALDHSEPIRLLVLLTILDEWDAVVRDAGARGAPPLPPALRVAGERVQRAMDTWKSVAPEDAAPLASALDAFRMIAPHGLRPGPVHARAARDLAAKVALLRARHPRNVDAIRLLHAFASEVKPRSEAVRLLLLDDGYDPKTNPRLWIERARSALSLIAMMDATEDARTSVTKLKAALEATPPTEDEDDEAQRELVLGDIAAWEAAHGDRSQLAVAAERYARAEPRAGRELHRLRNNRAYALAAVGKTDEALTLYGRVIHEDDATSGGLRWVALLNLMRLTAPTTMQQDVLAALKLHSLERAPMAEVIAHRWLATHAQDATVRKASQQRLQKSDGDSLVELSPGGGALCHNRPPSIKLLSTPKGVELGLYWWCELWLTSERFDATAATTKQP